MIEIGIFIAIIALGAAIAHRIQHGQQPEGTSKQRDKEIDDALTRMEERISNLEDLIIKNEKERKFDALNQ